jgi:diacylglycerol kinase (ATP)
MKIAIIHNPVAGSGKRNNRASRLIVKLTEAGHAVRTYTTGKPGDATTLAQQAIFEGAEVVVAAGGDGTVNEVIQGMVGSEVPLAVYPAGTTNVWCKQVKMPRNPRRAAGVIGGGLRRQIDLGRANNRYFLLMTGIGLDGEITQAVDLKLKKRIGKAAYALAAVQAGLRFRAVPITLELDDLDGQMRSVTTRTGMVIVTNTERYAVMKLAREAQMDDGQLEILVFKEKNFFSRLRRAVSLLTSSCDRDPNIERYRVRHVRIEVANSVGMQIDGDPTGYTDAAPLNIECIPAALKVIVPANVPSRYFSRNVA